MTLRQRLGIGLAGLWPVVYAVLLASNRSLRVLTLGSMPAVAEADAPRFGYLDAKVLLALTSLVILGLVVVCLMHLARTKELPEEQQLPWALLLITASVLAVPVYWYLYIWCSTESPPAGPRVPP